MVVSSMIYIKFVEFMQISTVISLCQDDFDHDLDMAEAAHDEVCRREMALLLEIIYANVEPTDGSKPTQEMIDAALESCEHCLPDGVQILPDLTRRVYFVYTGSLAGYKICNPIGVWCKSSRLFYRGLSAEWAIEAKRVFEKNI